MLRMITKVWNVRCYAKLVYWFFLDKSWSDHKFWEKAHNLVKWWPRIIEQAGGIEDGAAFQVKCNFSGKGKFVQVRL